MYVIYFYINIYIYFFKKKLQFICEGVMYILLDLATYFLSLQT